MLQPSEVFTELGNAFIALFDGSDEKDSIVKFEMLKSAAGVTDGSEPDMQNVMRDASGDVKEAIRRCIEIGNKASAIKEIEARL